MSPYDLLALNWILWGLWAVTVGVHDAQQQTVNHGTLTGQGFIAITGGVMYFMHRIYG